MAWTYARAKQELARARNPLVGRPIQHETRVMLVDDSTVAIQHYNTQIVRFCEDGRVQIHAGWTSQCTLGRIYTYTGQRIWTKRNKAVNGFLPMEKRTHVITGKDGKDYVFKSRGDYITIKADGHIDLATLAPRHITVVSDPITVRRVHRKIKLLSRQVATISRLDDRVLRSSMDKQNKWLRHNAALPFDAVDWVNAPSHIDPIPAPVHLAERLGLVEAHQLFEV